MQGPGKDVNRRFVGPPFFEEWLVLQYCIIWTLCSGQSSHVKRNSVACWVTEPTCGKTCERLMIYRVPIGQLMFSWHTRIQ